MSVSVVDRVAGVVRGRVGLPMRTAAVGVGMAAVTVAVGTPVGRWPFVLGGRVGAVCPAEADLGAV